MGKECKTRGEFCVMTDVPCCSGFSCNEHNGLCEVPKKQCYKENEKCLSSDYAPCCNGLYCDGHVGICLSTETHCTNKGDLCLGLAPCCKGSYCEPGTGTCEAGSEPHSQCLPPGSDCSSGGECCSCGGGMHGQPGSCVKVGSFAMECSCGPVGQVIV